MGIYASKPERNDEKSGKNSDSESPPVTPLFHRKLTLLDELDPRSPSSNIVRTPIILSDDKEEVLPVKLRNKNLEKVRKVLKTTPRRLSDTRIPPKLIASSPLKKPVVENKRHSMVGVLETNLDYVETDLDEVFKKKNVVTPKKLDNDSKIDMNELIEVIQEENKDNVGNSDNVIVDDDGLIVKTDNNLVKSKEDLVEDLTSKGDILSDNIVILSDNIVILSDNNDILSNDNDILSNDHDILSNNDYILSNNDNNAPSIVEVTPKQTNTSKLNDFSKKINNLIFTDDDNENTINGTNSDSSVKPTTGSSRTPLGTRNMNARRSQPKLKVSDKPRKSEYAVSKIPVFKDKRRLSTQCENTPPKEMFQNVRKKGMTVQASTAKWDTEQTLII